MTKQIVIKLNEKKFRPLFDSIKEKCGTSKSDSELAGKALFNLYLQLFEKIPNLENQTMLEFFSEIQGKSFDEMHMEFLRAYSLFLEKGKHK